MNRENMRMRKLQVVQNIESMKIVKLYNSILRILEFTNIEKVHNLEFVKEKMKNLGSWISLHKN